jgi:hypothetical protein
MAEPLRKYSSADVPEFASYQAEPVTVEVREFGVVSEYDAMPSADASGYDEQGRQIGAALGRLVNKINEVIAPIRSKVSDQVYRLQDDAELAKSSVERTYEDVTSRVRVMASQGLCQARARAADLRRKSAQTVNDYPMQTLAAIGVAGVIAGVGLRAWRENRG